MGLPLAIRSHNGQAGAEGNDPKRCAANLSIALNVGSELFPTIEVEAMFAGLKRNGFQITIGRSLRLFLAGLVFCAPEIGSVQVSECSGKSSARTRPPSTWICDASDRAGTDQR